MAKYKSKYSGKIIDHAVERVLMDEETDKIVDSSPDTPVDLDSISTNEGSYTIYHFTDDNGETVSLETPIKMEVFKCADGGTGQRYDKNGITMERKLDVSTGEWSEWKPKSDVIKVEGNEPVQVEKETMVFRIVKDTSEVVSPT